MIHIKSPQEIESMRKGGKILADVLFEVLTHVKPGVSELEINDLAEALIRRYGGEPGFKKVPGWKHAICASTNDVIVHGIPTEYRYKEGDVVGIDCGVILDGLNTDMSETICILNGKPKLYDGRGNATDDGINRFLHTGKHALDEAIRAAAPGTHVGYISKTIQGIVEGSGYAVVRSLVGHGVGRKLHEEPEIPGFLFGSIEKTPVLKEGMVIAIEVIYNMGKKDMIYDKDGWTIRTKDGSISGLFERTIAITGNGNEVLTKSPVH